MMQVSHIAQWKKKFKHNRDVSYSSKHSLFLCNDGGILMFKNLFKKQKTPLKHHIEICISNIVYGDPNLFDRLLEHDNIEIEEVGCNSHCEICEVGPYAILNNECITATSETELYEKIMQYIKQVEF